MSSDLGHWERVASELRACREAQQQAWGDVDNATLGRYLAGDVTPEERRRIETALESLPELRKLTDLVSDVLRDCEPASPAAPARRDVLPFRPAAPAVKTKTPRWRRWAAVAAAASVLLALGYLALPRDFARYAPRGANPVALTSDDLTNITPGSSPDIKNVVAMHQPLPSAGEAGGWDWNFFDAKGREKSESSTRKLDPVVIVADGLTRAGSAYEKSGDLDLAEVSYKLAYSLDEWRLGEEAPATTETRRNLGAVYQTALAMDTDRRDLLLEHHFEKIGPPAPAANDKDGKEELRQSAALLRQRITKQTVRDLRLSVVPVLVQNLREARTPEEREQLSRALAQLGPAARDAVPALQDCLRKAKTPQESAALVSALGEAGPAAAPEAAPVLVSSLRSDSPEVRRAAEDALAGYGRGARDDMLKMADSAASDRPEWRGLKERLNGVEGRIGVRDGSEVLSVLALRQSQREIRELARTHGVEVYAETRPALPPPEEAKADKERQRDVTDDGVYLVIHPAPLHVDAYVGQSLRDEGLDVARLRQAVENASREDLDQGLLAGVRFVERFAAERAKKAPPEAPAKPG
jgi:hypothetical protein